MALYRAYQENLRQIISTTYDGYQDRLSHWSDIREYLPFLYEQTRSREKVKVLELGCRTGNSTLAFLAGAEVSGGHVWSVDVDNVIARTDGMLPWKGESRWSFIYGSDMDPGVYGLLPEVVDILFIDTSHEYEHTVRELELYVPRVAQGGVVLCHDTYLTGWPGLVWDDPAAPVWKALDDFCAATGREWKNLAGEYGLGIIEVPR